MNHGEKIGGGRGEGFARNPENPIGFVGPLGLVGAKIPDIAPHMRNALGALEGLLAPAQRRLGCLQRRYVDAQPGDPAVGHAAFGDQHPAAVAQPMLDRSRGIAVLADQVGQPFLFVPHGIGIEAVGKAGANDVFQPGARDDAVAALAKQHSITRIADDQAVLLVED